MCERGELVWAASGGKDPPGPTAARLRFLFRGEGHLFLPPEPEAPELSPAAGKVLAFLQSEGACFLADLEAGTDLPAAELPPALVELVLAGLVTNDTLQALREVLAWSADPDGPARRPLSSLEAELSAWRQERRPARPMGQRPPAGRSCSAPSGPQPAQVERTTPPRWPGRWSLVHRIGVWGREVPPEERLARQARQLYSAMASSPARAPGTRMRRRGCDIGRPLYRQFQLMEMRGEVRRGYFVQGLPGVQFALPEAVERLREWTRPAESAESRRRRLVLLNAADPANLFGPSLARGKRPDAAPKSGPEAGATTQSKGGDRPGGAHATRPALRASRPTMSCCCGAGRCCCWRPAGRGRRRCPTCPRHPEPGALALSTPATWGA